MCPEWINAKNTVIRKLHPTCLILVGAEKTGTNGEVVGSRVKYHGAARCSRDDWSDQNVSVGQHFGTIVAELDLSHRHRADFRPGIVFRIVDLRRVCAAAVFSASDKNTAILEHVRSV